MAAKDLYNILQVPPTANLVEIKKAYRKLALQYHPDKNPNDELSANRFLEIKKAYEVLGNAAKRQQYNHDNWKQKRHAQTSHSSKSPQSILQKINELASHVNNIDIFRMSEEALYLQTIEILSDENIDILKHDQDNAINKKIVERILKTVQPLSFKYVKKLEIALINIAFTDNETIQTIHNYIKHKKKINFWDKYNLIIILIITIVICIIIFIAGN